MKTRPSVLGSTERMSYPGFSWGISLGREPSEMPHENPGYDILSVDPKTDGLVFIEVKGKAKGRDTVTLSKTQIYHALNKPDSFILAVVEVDGDEALQPHYIREAFAEDPGFAVTSVTYNLSELLEIAEAPA